jgi:hypothetical protein
VYLVTFSIHHLVFQVLVNNAAVFPRRTDWQPFVRAIWPFSLTRVPWPPSEALPDSQAVQALATSFSNAP